MSKTVSRIAEKSEHLNLDRRDFIKVIGGGLVIVFSVDSQSSPLQGPPQGFGFGGSRQASDINAYLRIGEDGKVTVYSGKIEQGQGNTTALAQMAADELDVSLDAIQMIMGDTDLCPWDMGTFGSMSIRVFGPALRSAAAEAKAILIEMAAEQLNIPKQQLKAENGIIYSVTDNKLHVAYAQLTKGQKITRKLDQKVAPKPVSAYTVIGKSPMHVDAIEKVSGKAKYTGDFRFPDLMYAKLLRPPSHSAILKNVDTSEAEKYPGAMVINQDGLIAVLHQDPEAAEKALCAIKTEYDVPENLLDENNIFEHLLKAAPRPQPSERKGDLVSGEKASALIFEEEYRNGYGAHGSIETHTACAKMEDGKMTVWISTQAPFMNQSEIARAIGLPAQNVRVITPYVGGGFGGKSTSPQAVEAARLAKITGKPVQVSYSRTEEFFYDAFRPASIVKIKSGVDNAGKIILWDYQVYYAGNRSAEQFYDVPNNLIRMYGSMMGSQGNIHPFPTGTWRAPGANINIFARESQIDIMASKLKIDPLEFRLKNTSDPRMRRVLEDAAQRFGYTSAPSPSGRGYGIACGIDAETYVAEIAEISIDKNNRVKVKRVVASQDMGVVINPKGAIMQMEGCIMMGLGYTLSEDIKFKGGKIATTNFHDYLMPKFSWLPKIDAFLIKNDELPAKGGGEPAIAPVGGAIANAIFDVTGVRVFQMPLTPERISQAKK
jgi:nicotinate dehydrogenase subunit B